MELRYRAFSFVDRITSVQAGREVAGLYAVPGGLESFPASLAAEAVGQLAAWSAMAALDFRSRPVAGLAAAIELLGPVRPGQVLQLAAQLESVDEEAVSYGGTASVGGVTVIRLSHCVGPMMKVEEFDDPQAVRARFALLCGPGAEPGAFGGLPALAPQRTNGETGQAVCATLEVPASGAFFADHFPRRPVFPGTLLMHSNLELAAALAAERTGPGGAGRWALREIANVKLRAFTPPGERLEIRAEVAEQTADRLRVAVETRNAKRTVGSAHVRLAWEGPA
jgi:3-hydroxymyristoyl/3-hydroxydecanoyl-(acyl carrier protein) dehydratase